MQQPTNVYEGRYRGEAITSEAEGARSRDVITVLSGRKLGACRVIGKVTIGAISRAAGANTGNGTMSAPTAVDSTIEVGNYLAKCVTAAANGGTFAIYTPKGHRLPDAVVGVAYTGGGLNFTISDGSTDFIVGDSFTITVAAGSGKVVAVAPAALDGSQTAAGMLLGTVDATSADQPGVIIARDAELSNGNLDWGTLNGGQITTATAQLAALGIIVRATI